MLQRAGMSPTARTASIQCVVSFQSRYSISTIPLGLLLSRYNLVFDLVIGRLWKHLLLDQFILSSIRSTFDDLVGIRITDAGEPLELVCRGAVEIKEVG